MESSTACAAHDLSCIEVDQGTHEGRIAYQISAEHERSNVTGYLDDQFARAGAIATSCIFTAGRESILGSSSFVLHPIRDWPRCIAHAGSTSAVGLADNRTTYRPPRSTYRHTGGDRHPLVGYHSHDKRHTQPLTVSRISHANVGYPVELYWLPVAQQ